MNPDRTLRTQLVEVTPALADKWLADHNRGNRPMSKHIVRKYAQDMRDGLWMLTHQGPAFDDADRLIDGQHRLAAVVEAQADVPMYVTFGADPETFTVLDINYKRQPSHLVPGPRSAIKASAARMLTRPPAIFYNSNAHNRDIVRIVSEHPALDEAAAIAQRVYAATKINSSMHAALLTLVLESPAAHLVEDWAEGLTTGAGLASGDARLPLRNKWALDAKHLNAGAGRNDALFFIIRAWNAYARGESMANLRLPRGGAADRNTVPTPFLGGESA